MLLSEGCILKLFLPPRTAPSPPHSGGEGWGEVVRLIPVKCGFIAPARAARQEPRATARFRVARGRDCMETPAQKHEP
jgi:hypothetical protein